MLEGWIGGPSQWSPEWELAVQDTRWPGCNSLRADERQRDGGQPGLLQDIGEHTDRARTRRSDRREQDDIDTVLV